VLMYEFHDIRRFNRPGQFLSYARLVKCAPPRTPDALYEATVRGAKKKGL
jgi:hypothetical protein